MDSGLHEHLEEQSDLQSISSTSTPYQASEHSSVDYLKLGARPKNKNPHFGERPSSSQRKHKEASFLEPQQEILQTKNNRALHLNPENDLLFLS